MAWHRIGRGGNKYWGKKGAGIFFTDGHRVLLLKRSEKGDQEDTWGLPGGKAEYGESAIANAIREAEEECGTVKGKRFDSLESQDGHHHWTTFFFKVDKPFECKISDEHKDWKWVRFDELDKYDLHPKLEDQIGRYLRLLSRKSGLTFSEWIKYYN